MSQLVQPPKDLPNPSLRVLSDRLLILPDKTPDKSRGGIILPDNVKDKHPQASAWVVQVGPGMPCNDGSRWPMPDVKRGDHIIYLVAPFGIQHLTVDGVKVDQIRQEHVLGVIEHEPGDNEHTLSGL